jgi:hypothetical protein
MLGEHNMHCIEMVVEEIHAHHLLTTTGMSQIEQMKATSLPICLVSQSLDQQNL